MATFWDAKTRNDLLELFIPPAGRLIRDEVLYNGPAGLIPMRVTPYPSAYSPKLLELRVS